MDNIEPKETNFTVMPVVSLDIRALNYLQANSY